MILLDTGILFDFLADRPGANLVEDILKKGKGAVSTITLYELFRVVQAKKHVEQRHKLSTFLHKIDVTEHIARIAGEIYTDLKSKGNLIDNEDILIGATSLYHRMPLFTSNQRHFNLIPKLLLFEP
jgi:predicted nucleic acid-binding protein